jgi:H+/Cl- antiporter ClcA
MHDVTENRSVKWNSLTISEIMKEHPKILLTLFNDLPHYQHFPFYALLGALPGVLSEALSEVIPGAPPASPV